MIVSLEDRIYATVAYADIFDFPLTISEIRYWMIGHASIPRKLPSRLTRIRLGSQDYITLKGRQVLVTTRKRREQIALHKWSRAVLVGNWLRWIPSILLVGVTGGLAMENAKANDDIDLFFITAPNTLWTSRLLVTVVTQVLGVRRTPNNTHVADSICLNMFMAQSSLTLAKSEQDLFAAHEVLQMQPLWQRENMYRQFLLANRWVQSYVPAAWAYKMKSKSVAVRKNKSKFLLATVCFLLALIEPFARLFQLWYMQKRRTTEVIEKGVLRFHPRDARLWIKKKYADRFLKANIMLEFFYFMR
jgi:hypothetical protein